MKYGLRHQPKETVQQSFRTLKQAGDGKALTVSIHRTLSINGNKVFFVIESSKLRLLQADVFTFKIKASMWHFIGLSDNDNAVHLCATGSDKIRGGDEGGVQLP